MSNNRLTNTENDSQQPSHNSQPLFFLGSIVATPGALELLETHGLAPLHYLRRHVAGDWGDLCKEDRDLNDRALVTEGRLFSSYTLGNDKLWIITEWDRSVTTLLLPSEY